MDLFNKLRGAIFICSETSTGIKVWWGYIGGWVEWGVRSRGGDGGMGANTNSEHH